MVRVHAPALKFRIAALTCRRAIVGVSGVHPVLELLQRPHPQLFEKAKKLIAAASRTTQYGAVKSPWPYT
jgi:hypothetical protein